MQGAATRVPDTGQGSLDILRMAEEAGLRNPEPDTNQMIPPPTGGTSLFGRPAYVGGQRLGQRIVVQSGYLQTYSLTEVPVRLRPPAVHQPEKANQHNALCLCLGACSGRSQGQL